MRKFTDREISRELKREIGMRTRVYPRQVAAGRMTQPEADERVAILVQLAQEIEQRIADRNPQLFGDED